MSLAARPLLLAMSLALLLAPSAALAAPKAPAKPAKAAKPSKAAAKLGGKAFVTADRLKDQDPDSLAQQFENAPAQAVIARGKNGHWVGTLVAFFKKPSVQGPVIVWVFDKADKQSLKDREPVQAITVESTPKDVLVHEVDFDPDQGYNKEHVYLVRVGQIIAKKEKVYSSGEVKLLK